MYLNFFNSLKLIVFIFFGALVSNREALAQDQKIIDSLNVVLSKSSSDKKAEVLIGLGIEYTKGDVVKSLRYFDEAHSISLENGDSVGIVYSGWLKGEMLRRIERIDESIEILNYVLPIAERNIIRKYYKRILNTLAVNHTFLANYDKALEYHFLSLIAREEDDEKEAVTVSLTNIGLVYFKLRNYEKALEYYDRTMKMKEEIGDSHDMDVLLLNMGLCYNSLNNYDEAQRLILKSYSLCGDNCPSKTKIEGEFGLGNAFLGLNKLAEAERHFSN